MKTKVLFNGGFHKSSEIKLYIDFSRNSLIDYADGKISLKELIDENLTPYQRKRLENHFCGIKGCTCGSWNRADIDDEEIKKNASYAKTAEDMKNRPRSPFYEKCTGIGLSCGNTSYKIDNPEEFAKKYAAENGYARYEIVTTGYKFSTFPDVYFSGDGRAIGFFKK